MNNDIAFTNKTPENTFYTWTIWLQMKVVVNIRRKGSYTAVRNLNLNVPVEVLGWRIK
jgi:hypothetical protein